MEFYEIYDQTDSRSQKSANANSDFVTISSSHFGTNALLNDALLRDNPSQGHADIENLNIKTLRYPGGTVTEELFSMNNPENSYGQEDNGGKTDIIPISEFLDFASKSEASVSIVIPTRKGLNLSASKALELGQYGHRQPTEAYLQDVSNFVVDVLAKANSRGVIVESFELGNEFWLGGRMTAEEYGRLAGRLATTIDDAMSEIKNQSFRSPDILLQSVSNAGKFSPRETKEQIFFEDGKKYIEKIPGQGSAGKQIDAIKRELRKFPDAINAIDGIVDHYYDKQGHHGVDTEGQYIFEQFNELSKWLEGIRSPELPPLKRYVTEWNVKRAGGNEPKGLEGTSINIEMFYEMVTHGVVAAHFWPLVGGDNNLAGTDEGVSINGQAFRLMSESLVGLQPILDYENAKIDVHGFANSERSVFFVSERSGKYQSDISIDIGQVFDGGKYFISITSLADNNENDIGTEASPVMAYSNGFIASDSILNLNLDAWSIARIEMTYMTPSSDHILGRNGNDTVVGGNGHDTLSGGSGEDMLHGQTGDDFIFGGDGHDTLRGGFGDDSLDGNEGNDSLFGEEGNDFLFPGLGSDTIDGGVGNDTLSFEKAEQSVILWPGLGKVEIGHFVTDFSNIEVIKGSNLSDNISIRLSNQKIYGLAGDDNLQILDGRRNSIDLGAGEDLSLIYDGDTNFLRGGDGDDEFFIFGGKSNSYAGDDGNDSFYFYGGDNHEVHFSPGDGDDIISGFDVRRDKIFLNDYASETSIKARLRNDGVKIDLGTGDSIRLVGVFDVNVSHVVDFL